MNQICIVSGCSRGIGRAIAIQLAKSGYSCGLLSRSKWEIEELKEIISSNGRNHIAIACDVCKEDEVKGSIRRIAKELGNPTVLVNVAGMTIDGLLIRYPKESMEMVLQTNLVSNMIITRTVLPYMMKERSGSIVSIGSIVGRGGRSGQSVYAASKSALRGYTRSLAKEMGRYGIRVNLVEPGFIQTQMTESSSLDINQLRDRIPLGRIGSVSDVANAVDFLVSERASYITGAVVFFGDFDVGVIGGRRNGELRFVCSKKQKNSKLSYPE